MFVHPQQPLGRVGLVLQCCSPPCPPPLTPGLCSKKGFGGGLSCLQNLGGEWCAGMALRGRVTQAKSEPGIGNFPNPASARGSLRGLSSLIFLQFSPITANRVRLIILCILSSLAAPQLLFWSVLLAGWVGTGVILD